MSEWVSIFDRMPEIHEDQPERTVEVLLYFGTHIESGCFYFTEDSGRPYHVLFDGESLSHEPTHWQPLPSPPLNQEEKA
jgi:hypothetical protein